MDSPGRQDVVQTTGADPAPTSRRITETPAQPLVFLRVAATAVLVGAAYYVGAQVGASLRFPPNTPSVLWPPNSILTAVLLLAPTRRWWVYLLAALPAHLAMPAPPDWPRSLILALYATNCSEALIAAGCVRALGGGAVRFDTLRRMLVFVLGAGVLAPFASSFLDAGAVTALKGQPYWTVWQTRFFANVLTELTLVPVIVLVVTRAGSWTSGASVRRKLEAALLAIALAAVAGTYVAGGDAIPGAPLASVAFFLPVLLWAAARFGPAGASLCLLGTTLTVIWAGMRAKGLMAAMPPSDAVLAVQISLSLCAVPLLCVAGLIEERRRDQQALTERLTFEEMLSALSGDFVHLPSDRMDDAFDEWLARLGRALRLDRVILLRLSGDGDFAVAHSWASFGVTPAPRTIVNADYPWTVARLRREQPMVFSEPGDLPDEAARDLASLRELGVRSKLALPLVAGGRVYGGLALVTVNAGRAWPPRLVGQLQLVAEVLANALARKESEDALRASEVMKSAILASLDSSVGVLDRRGLVIATNPEWGRFLPHEGQYGGVGANYLRVCGQMASKGLPLLASAITGIESVLNGSRSGYLLEYSCRTPAGERWYLMSVVPLHRPDGGAVVSHTDVTERKRAEVEAQRSRQELAHFTRVSTMGELTASLAHELNQPLAGILTNAQAAQRFLEVSPLDVHEVRSALDDIIEDDRRAAEVILRLRDLMRKGDLQMRLLDLNLLIRDVVKLLGSDTVIRNIVVVLDLDHRPAVVSGDRVQLQQVVLNLLLNAMEAMAESPVADRRLHVRTEAAAPHGVAVVVADAGPGLPKGTEELVFEPFYTTKSSGMGMGLAIARSIIDAHGGRIWAESAPPHGAAFRFHLPRADEEPA